MIFYDSNRKVTNTEVGPGVGFVVAVVVKNLTMLFACLLFISIFHFVS